MARENSEAELDSYINDLADIKDEPVIDNSGGSDDDVKAGAEQQQQQTVDGTGTPDVKTDAQTPQDKSGAVDKSGTKQKANDPKGQQPKQGQQAPDAQPNRPLGDGTFADASGNIVDKDGKLIAQSGFAARLYHTNRRLKAQLDESNTNLSNMSRAVGEVQSLARSIQQYGLNNDEVAQAMDLAGRMKRGDVVGVAKDILAMVTAQGYNVTDLLGKDVGDSIEMRAMKRMLDERFAPITQQQQSRQFQTEAEQRGRAAYNKFVNDNEFADVHADVITQVMQREQVGPQVAYNRLLTFATRNGLDFSQPLAPQIQARQQQPQVTNGQQQQQQRNGQQTKPMPNGATTRAPGAVPSVPYANADDDWGSIISEVQRTVGH